MQKPERKKRILKDDNEIIINEDGKYIENNNKVKSIFNVDLDEHQCESCNIGYYFSIIDEEIYLCNQCIKNKYREDLKLNKLSLDDHSEEQHMRAEKWYSCYIEMKDISGIIKLLLDEEKAKIDSEIRLSDSDNLRKKFKIDKLTVDSITSAINRDKRYLRMLYFLNMANKRRDILLNAKESFKERSSMIWVLKDLHKSMYFERNVDSKRDEDKIGETVRIPR